MQISLMAAQEIEVMWDLRYWLIQKLGLAGTAAALTILGFAVLCIVVPYLIGSINPAILISKLVYGDDIRNHGSGNAGTTNMLRTFGGKAAVATLVLDFSKAIVATLLGKFLLGVNGAAIAGFFVGFGHMFPIYYRFRGGKGVACFAMVALVIHPFVFLALVGTFLVIAIGTRYVSLASVMSAFLFPFYMRAFANEGLNVAMAVLAAVFVAFMHRENMKRVWDHTESKLDFSKFKSKKKKNAQEKTAADACDAPAQKESEDSDA